MQKKPLLLRLRQKIYNWKRYLIIVIYPRFTSDFWCRVGVHSYKPTPEQELQCIRCGKIENEERRDQ